MSTSQVHIQKMFRRERPADSRLSVPSHTFRQVRDEHCYQKCDVDRAAQGQAHAQDDRFGNIVEQRADENGRARSDLLALNVLAVRSTPVVDPPIDYRRR